jgi:hypothetical protein
LSQRSVIPPATDRACPERAAGPELVEGIERATQPPLSLAEKRLFLAHLVRLNLLDCLDDSGAFDLTRARRLLTGGVIQQITIEEVEKTCPPKQTTCEGGTIRRKITIRLVDKLRAIKLDDTLETSERRARAETEEQRARAEQAARESQARAVAHRQYDDIEKETDARVWTVLHQLSKDSAGNLLPGITIEMLNDALANVSRRRPRPPP